MAAKRRARRPRPDDSKELGRNGGIEEESGVSGETATSAEPKEMPPKQAEQPSAPSTKDAGGQASGEAYPERSAPRGGVALEIKKTSDSGGASPARYPLPDDTADAGHNKRGLAPKRGPPPRQGEERPGKRPAQSDGETVVAASALQQLRTALTKPTSPPSSPDITYGRETAEQEESNTSRPQDEHRGREEEQQEKKKRITEQDHAGDTSLPYDKDTHSAHGEEQQEKEAANQEHVDETSQPKDNHTKPRCSETEKKPGVERSWSYGDELKILNALVVHAQSHNGALPDSSHLLANLTFDKIDATEDKLTDKIRKLRRRYCKFLLQGCPSDDLNRRLFKLSEILWGQADEDERADEDEQVEPTSRDFSILSKLYPHLAKEVKAYAETHCSGDLIMSMFMTIGDEKARDLDAKCKKQHIEAFKLELGKASLTNELLSALSSLTTKITDPLSGRTMQEEGRAAERAP